VEFRWVERHRLNLPKRHHGDVDARLVQKSAMKELHLEGQVLAAPKRLVRPEADVPVLVVSNVREIVWQTVVRSLVIPARRFPRQVPHRLEREGPLPGRCTLRRRLGGLELSDSLAIAEQREGGGTREKLAASKGTGHARRAFEVQGQGRRRSSSGADRRLERQ
jgi:hypothetical protein